MNVRSAIWLLPGLLAGVLGASAAPANANNTLASQDTAYTGRRADHLPHWRSPAAERAEFAAMDASRTVVVSEPAYSGRRADHVPHVLVIGGERSEFAALSGSAAQPGAVPRSEAGYSGRRADHLDLLRE